MALGTSRIRQRKLNTRATLPILREDQLDDTHDDQNNVPRIETGVEKGEEVEHHLQAAIAASQVAAAGGNVAKTYIPTRGATQGQTHYDSWYPSAFSQPATYIRFSSTVEDCTGTQYDLDEDDDAFLKSMNKTKTPPTRCSDDQFEQVMYCFEETAQVKQPYAAVDSPPVLSWNDIEPMLDENLEDSAKLFAKEIYEHWRTRRLAVENKALVTSLKFEIGADTDDADPYVCFRRREVRQIRKTRGRDAHSAEKLKKLRKELEEARELLQMIRQREVTKRDSLALDRQLFEQRSSLRNVKQNLPDQYKVGDEELLINQKKKKTEITIQRPPGSLPRLPTRSDGRPVEADLFTLADALADQERQISKDIEAVVEKHKLYNQSDLYVDMTKAPLTPPLDVGTGSTFRTATTEYLPTPPASISSEQSGDAAADAAALNSCKLASNESVAVRYASPSYDGSCRSQPSFRRRYGRGGRLWIDRRGMRLPGRDADGDSPMTDRFRFDDEDEDEVPTYFIDPFDTDSMRFRARLFPSPSHAQQQAARQAQIEAARAQAAVAGNQQRRQSGD